MTPALLFIALLAPFLLGYFAFDLWIFALTLRARILVNRELKLLALEEAELEQSENRDA